MSDPPSPNGGDAAVPGDEELGYFLEGLGKKKYLDKLDQAGILSVDQLADDNNNNNNNNTVIAGVPRMVVRLLQNKARETRELRWVLRGADDDNMIKYQTPLLQAKIYSLTDLLAAADSTTRSGHGGSRPSETWPH